MRDRSLIYLGLLIFLAVVTFPFTYNLAAGSGEMPDLEYPDNETQCVESKEFMRSSHMQLLVDWRESLVRENVRTHKTSDGRTYDISLTNTCLAACHTRKGDFCDRCHDYSGVENPYCWDCHIDPEQTERSAR
ncbi:MAG: sulfate reduction electron transfer complex DsrMKJOP subunit DsrJ [Acidobacteria bacterium]|nr:sulfate reduction electron transfer complex DsrMKJOP subunit DsrJ [Acidobacteriota bacterium]